MKLFFFDAIHFLTQISLTISWDLFNGKFFFPRFDWIEFLGIRSVFPARISQEKKTEKFQPQITKSLATVQPTKLSQKIDIKYVS